MTAGLRKLLPPDMYASDYVTNIVLSVILIVGAYQFYFFTQRHPVRNVRSFTFTVYSPDGSPVSRKVPSSSERARGSSSAQSRGRSAKRRHEELAVARVFGWLTKSSEQRFVIRLSI